MTLTGSGHAEQQGDKTRASFKEGPAVPQLDGCILAHKLLWVGAW